MSEHFVTPPGAAKREDCMHGKCWHVDQVASLAAQLAEMQATFDLRWKADMRAIKRWQKAHPEKPLTWPDHVDLVLWLDAQLEQERAGKKAK